VRTTPNSLFWRTPSSLLLAIADQRVASALGLVPCSFPEVCITAGCIRVVSTRLSTLSYSYSTCLSTFCFRSDDGDQASNSDGGRRRHSAPANTSTSAATAQPRDPVGADAGFKATKPARGSANGGKAEQQQQQRSPPTAAQLPLPAAVALISARTGDETQGQFGPGLAAHHHGSQGDLGAGAPGSAAAGGGGSDFSKSSSMPRMQQRAEAGHFLEGEVKRTEMGRVISRGGVATLSGSGPQAPHSGGGRGLHSFTSQLNLPACTRPLLSSS